MYRKVSLFEVSSALSNLVFAVKETLDPILCDVEAHYRNSTGLFVEIECYAKHQQLVLDRLAQGALVRNYDYRFRSFSYAPLPKGGAYDPLEWVEVVAYVDIHHDHRKTERERDAKNA